ncbi:hypothetical protein ACX40Y_00335 [Sphingomonas sp. RS6]
MTSRPAMIAPEVIDCIANGRQPRVDELYRVAGHIWADLHPGESAFSWGDASDNSSERLITLRVAQAALVGSGKR